MSAHTQGPWTIVENSWSDTSVVDSEGNLVAKLSIYGDATEDNQTELEMEMATKAKLIAATPDLLNALCEMIDMAILHRWHIYQPEILKVAFDAFKKATGSEK